MNPAEIERLKELLPTSLGSAEIREQIAADILRRSVFSARMESAHYLAKIREVCAAILDGTINQAEARTRLLATLQQLGYDPATGDPADLKDPVSERRLNLIVDTQRQMAASVSRLMQQDEGTLEQNRSRLKVEVEVGVINSYGGRCSSPPLQPRLQIRNLGVNAQTANARVSRPFKPSRRNRSGGFRDLAILPKKENRK